MSAGPETILVLAANPIVQAPLNLAAEVRKIRSALRHSKTIFNVQSYWSVRTEDLRRALLDHQPEFLHFCGHGEGQDGIFFEDKLVTTDALAELFSLFSQTLRCVVLNACYSTVQATEICRHIEFVIGMSDAVGDTAATEFSVAFYDGIGAGFDVRFSFELGRNAIHLAGLPGHLIPVLHQRQQSEKMHSRNDQDVSSSTRYDWDGAPSVSMLFGREIVAELLRSWILEDLCRVILITGLGGVGKSDLVTCLARGGNRAAASPQILTQGLQQHFECVVWRSLLNPPSPEEFLADLLSVLSDHRSTPMGSGRELVEEVLACLQIRQCLLVLDNIETVLQPGNVTTTYRDGFEQFGWFLEQVARVDHKSCVLLTSREKPRTIAELEGARKPVRSIALTGIEEKDVQDLFAQIGNFTGTESDWKSLVALYKGNPLALELAARHIDQVFSGDLSAFLREGHINFSDLKELLSWHLDRLSPEEAEIVRWLAIERKPTTIGELRSNIYHPESGSNVASTLQSLQRRLPLERVDGGRFTLQPVLIEHITEKIVKEITLSLTDHIGLDRQGAREQVDKYALAKASAKENVYVSQKRFLLAPVAQALISEVGSEGAGKMLKNLVSSWRRSRGKAPGYFASNLFHLLKESRVDMRGLDFSGLYIAEAKFDDCVLHQTNFAFSEFHRCAFMYSFGSIYSLCYAPDGTAIAAGDDNGVIRVYSVSDGAPRFSCVGHSDTISRLAYSRDGEILASSSYDGSVRLWDSRDGTCVGILLGHRSWVYSVAFSPDGSLVASSSEDGTVRVWEATSGRCLHVLDEDCLFVACLDFSPDGSLLAFAGSDRVIKIIRVGEGKRRFGLVRTLIGHSGRIRALSFSPDGRNLASGAEDNLICLWDLSSEQPQKIFCGHSGSIIFVDFSPKGDLLLSSSNDLTVRMWQVATGECTGLIPPSRGRVWTVQFDATGKTFATGSEDSAVRVWDTGTLECLMSLHGYGNKAWSLAFGGDATLVSGNEDRLVRVWDISSGEVRSEMAGHASRLWAVACSKDGSRIASASDDRTVRVWSRIGGQPEHILRGHEGWVRGLAFSPQSHQLASAGEDGTVILWNFITGQEVWRLSDSTARFFSVAFGQEASLLAAAGAPGAILLISSKDGQVLGRLEGHEEAVNSIASCGDLLISGSDDSTAKLWDLRTLTCRATFDVGEPIIAVGISEDGDQVVAGTEYGVIHLWESKTGACIASKKAHDGKVLAIAFSLTEGVIASSGDDGIIRLFEHSTLQEVPGPNILRPRRPYEGMNITGTTGLTASQRESLAALGAIEIPSR